MLVFGGEDEFVDEDMRKSCNQLKVCLLFVSPNTTSAVAKSPHVLRIYMRRYAGSFLYQAASNFEVGSPCHPLAVRTLYVD